MRGARRAAYARATRPVVSRRGARTEQPRDHDLVREAGHVFFLETTAHELTLLVLVELRPLLDGHLATWVELPRRLAPPGVWAGYATREMLAGAPGAPATISRRVLVR